MWASIPWIRLLYRFTYMTNSPTYKFIRWIQCITLALFTGQFHFCILRHALNLMWSRMMDNEFRLIELWKLPIRMGMYCRKQCQEKVLEWNFVSKHAHFIFCHLFYGSVYSEIVNFSEIAFDGSTKNLNEKKKTNSLFKLPLFLNVIFFFGCNDDETIVFQLFRMRIHTNTLYSFMTNVQNDQFWAPSIMRIRWLMR